MQLQSSSNTLAILLSLIGVFFAITPASANIIPTTGTQTNTGIPGTVGTIANTTNAGIVTNGLTSNLQGTTNTTIGTLTGNATAQQTTASNPISSQLPTLNNALNSIENTAQATTETVVTNGVTSSLQETTQTNIGTLAGASTDSQTTATVVNPTEAQLPSLNNPTEIIQTTGQGILLGVEANQQGLQANVGADLTVGVGNLANIKICLDGSASIGSPDAGSLANCSTSTEPRKVPEPGIIGSLALLGVYFISRKSQLSSFKNHQTI
ncbi:PEP-CTERM sorting domain-containing protein [Cylindrospermum sp. FACHB-282]|uniref:PEP-CTERM sorting domain-containing protein n=1 Tax=Cylindrospermum sp. FACHB-282 TaxID=2692794 RepID=UPI001684BE04|nr:PEP-CTERM sorting domain-containing protein [Cylindrospermum sp. FACHB-282]MBD2385691.1 PEP-CTERM sorting domain-containing protein [Cylindrospermum sp. FACHB-282]